MDWLAWHAAYDDPSSPISGRLRRVRWHLAQAIDQAPAGPVRLVSLCAGQGRDVLGILPAHPRRHDVRALLVEADARNAELARRAADEAGVPQVEVRLADAGVVANFADALPADVLLLCGIFGNIAFEAPSINISIGVNRLRDAPSPGLSGHPLFTFREGG